MRSSASDSGSRSALGGSRPSRWSTASVDRRSTPDERGEEREEGAHGRSHPERGALRVAESDALRHELSDHDVEVGEDQIRKEDGERRRQPRLERACERLLAECTDTQRGERDAELHRGR